MTDITELAQSLKAAAEKATPGEWVYFPKNTSIEYDVGSDESQGSILYVDSGDFTQVQTDRNGEFIALANPANILALVGALEKAKGMEAYWKTQCRGITDHCEELQQRITELESHKAALLKFIRDSCYVFDGADEDISDAYVDAITSVLMPKLESVAACNPPLFWVRVKSDGGYEGPIHDSKLEEVRKKSGKWLPLTLAGGIPELESRTVTVKLPKPHAHLIWIQAGHAPDDYWDDVAVSHSEKDRCCDGSERYPVYARWEIEGMLTAAGIKVEAE
ncbi:ead/Ea22-like family protein [Klebsiella pneumoniae]|nr:ead/Ea22-like family protein [Klebsiella pneumoniae]MDK7833793.1 ead/Ea22-like family protein [Klebsiella pneumoniae]